MRSREEVLREFGINDSDICIGEGCQNTYCQMADRIRELEADAKRLDWLEENHTLHNSVEILYVVDGYNVDVMIHDGVTCHSSSHGSTLRTAIDHAMTTEVPADA